jgi:uncharacterized protein (TIGR03083 family)
VCEDTTFDPLEAIAFHSEGLAGAAVGNLEAPVQHCPGWTVADLVWHLSEVQWFWATIAEELLAEPPDESRKPPRVPDEQLVEHLRAASERLVQVLRDADPAAPAWTWAPAQNDVAFIERHQVQEAAVHHWDAADAAGEAVAIEPAVAADAVTEFLTFSVSSDDDQADPPRPSLDGELVLRSSDSGHAWTVTDGTAPGTVAFTVREAAGAGDGAPAVTATASDLLLWLYQRVELDTSAVPDNLLARFRRLCFTD